MNVEYLLTALIIVLVPGTGVIYTVATGLGQGRAASFAAACGCTLGILPAIIASMTGLAAILHTSAMAFQMVKFCGVAYLLYLAWKTLQDDGPLQVGDKNTDRHKSYIAIIRTGFLINVLNPKLTVFFFAFLPQFINPQAGPAFSQMLLMSAAFMIITLIVFSIYGWCSALTRDYVLRDVTTMKWIRRCVALTFGGFALRLALSHR